MPIERIALGRGGVFPMERADDLTASVIGGLFGVHPYWNVYKLYAKHRGVEVDDVDPMSAVIRRGHDLEDLIAKEVRKRHPRWKILNPKSYYRDPEARLGATPDRLIDGDARGLGVLQIKSAGSGVFRRSYTADNPPFWITLQCQTEMLLTGARFGLVAVRVLSDWAWDYHEYEIPHHDGAQQRIKDAVAAFWKAVAAGEQPKADYSTDGAVIAALYPNESPGKVIDLRGDNRIVELLETIERERIAMAGHEANLLAAQAEVQEKLAEAEFAIVPGWRVSWKTQTRKAHMVKETSFRRLDTRRTRNG